MTTDIMPSEQTGQAQESSPVPKFLYQEKIIDGFPNYAISNTGNVISLQRTFTDSIRTRTWYRKILKGGISRGHREALIYDAENNIHKTVWYHRLVANYFLEKPSSQHVVNHNDGNKLNNHVSNLEWVTSSENRLHAINVLGHVPKGTRGLDHSSCKRTPELLAKVKSLQIAGFSNRAIGKELGTSQTFINKIINGVYDG